MTQLIKNIESYLVEEYLENEKNFMNYVEDDIVGMLVDVLENVVKIKNLNCYREDGCGDGKYNVMICSSNKVLGVKRRRDIKEKRNQRMKIAKEEETINYSNTQNSSNNNTGNESNIGRKVLFKII